MYRSSLDLRGDAERFTSLNRKVAHYRPAFVWRIHLKCRQILGENVYGKFNHQEKSINRNLLIESPDHLFYQVW